MYIYIYIYIYLGIYISYITDMLLLHVLHFPVKEL